jgi:hypothetical protein
MAAAAAPAAGVTIAAPAPAIARLISASQNRCCVTVRMLPAMKTARPATSTRLRLQFAAKVARTGVATA